MKDSEFLIEALSILEKARIALKWSYCLGYYIDPKRVKTKQLYEDYQGIFE